MSELQNDGIPAGYRLVGVRKLRSGDLFVDRSGTVGTAGLQTDWSGVFPVVEAIPSIPSKKKITVVLSRYLVGDLKDVSDLRSVVCTAEYVDAYWTDYQLIEHVQTLEVEVDV